MPKLVSLEGVDIYMYFRDHAPPHVHAFHGDAEALVVIRGGSVYTGSLPTNKLTVVQQYVNDHVDDLLAQWAAYGGG